MGKKIVGTEIPIISEERGRKGKPDYFLILPWYFIEEFRFVKMNIWKKEENLLCLYLSSTLLTLSRNFER